VTNTAANVQELSGFVWRIAEILRGDFKQSEYGKVVLPFVVLRRLDCLLASTKDAVLKRAKSLPEGMAEDVRDMILFGAAGGAKVYNLHPLTFDTMRHQEAGQIHDILIAYITGFSANVRAIFFDHFRLAEQLNRLKDASTLWQVFERFAQIDLHPDRVSNIAMGYLFEELIRRFSEISNETAGEHFTPREVIRLIVDLLLATDKDGLSGQGIVAREVAPFVPDAWVDTGYCDETDGQVGSVGYEINFNRYFYRYEPPRPLEEIDAELKALEGEIATLLKEVAD
jgi:type I restriction enzyme M protein